MRKVGLSGYYGMSNYGDDLFARVAVLGVNRFWQSHTPTVVAPRQANGIEGGLPTWFTPSAYQDLGLKGKGTRFLALMAHAMLVDKLVFAGGSIFHSDSSSAIAMAVRGQVLKGSAPSAIGVSLGPFRSSSDECRTARLLRRFEFVAVRDKKSLDVAHSLGIEKRVVRAADLAALYPALAEIGPALQRHDDVIGFSPCALPGRSEAARGYCRAFVDLVRRGRKQRDYSVCVLGLNHHPMLGDEALCEYTVKLLREADIPFVQETYRDLGLDATWRRISSFGFYLTVRLHGALTAFATGTPFGLFEYHRKCADFLDEIGHPLRLGDVESHRGDSVESMREMGATGTVSASAYQAASSMNFTAAPWAQQA